MYGEGVGDEVVARAVFDSSDWWRPTRTLATWLTGLLAAQAISQLLFPVFVDNATRDVKWHAAFDALLDGRDETAQRIYNNSSPGTSGWSFVFSLVTTATLVLLIIWSWRSAHNARALGRTGARLAPVWAILGWIIPLASFVLPYVVVSDLWRSSEADAGRGDGWRSLPGASGVRLWWVAHVAGSILTFGTMGLAISGVTGEPETRSLLVAAAVVGAAACAVRASRWCATSRCARRPSRKPTPRRPPDQHHASTLPRPTVDGPGWYADPSGHFDHRYWDGGAWTEHVSNAGVPTTAPVTPPDWYPDPTGRFHWRYWTGHEWTEHVEPRPGAVRRPALRFWRSSTIRIRMVERRQNPRAGNGSGVAEVFGRLAHLPVAVVERGVERGIDGGSFERRQRQDRAPTHGRLVGARGEDHRQRGRCAECSECGDRRFACERVAVFPHDACELVDRTVRDGNVAQLTDCPRGRLDHGDVAVVEEGEERREGRRRRYEPGRQLGGSTANRG